MAAWSVWCDAPAAGARRPSSGRRAAIARRILPFLGVAGAWAALVVAMRARFHSTAAFLHFEPGNFLAAYVHQMQSLLGLGYDTLRSACDGFGIPGLASLDDVSECLVRHHVCRADQLLTSQTPRSHELLAIGGTAQP